MNHVLGKVGGRGISRSSKTYKQTIDNQPHNLHIPYVAGSGVGATSFQLNRKKRIYANQYRIQPNKRPLDDQPNSPWPEPFGYGSTNRNMSHFMPSPSLPHIAWNYSKYNYYGLNHDYYYASSIPIIAANGTVYIIYYYLNIYNNNIPATLYAFYNTGQVIWTSPLDDVTSILGTAPIIGTQGELYVVTTNSVFCISVNGERIWKFIDNGNEFLASPIFVANGILVLEMSRALLLDSNGNQLWSCSLAGQVFIINNTSPVPCADSKHNSYIITNINEIGSHIGYLQKVNASGVVQWTRTYLDIFTSNAVLSSDETVVFTTSGINTTTPLTVLILGFYTATGMPVWQYASPSIPNYYIAYLGNNLAVDMDDNIYISAYNYQDEKSILSVFNLHTYDPQTNNTVWSQSFEQVLLTTPVVDKRQNVLISSQGSSPNLYYIGSGETIWSLPITANNIDISNGTTYSMYNFLGTPSLDSNGNIFITNFAYSLPTPFIVYLNLYAIKG